MSEIRFLDANDSATLEGMLEFLGRLGRPGVAGAVVDELGYDEDGFGEDGLNEQGLDPEEMGDLAVQILARTTGLDQNTTRRIITMLSFTASVSGDALDFVIHNLDRDHGEEWDEYNLKGLARSVRFSLGESELA